MSIVKDFEQNTTVGRLHINHDNHDRMEFKEYVRDKIRNTEALPSGYSIFEGEGGWFPESEGLEDEIEPKSLLEMWIDTEEELKAVRDLKIQLEDKFDQHCVCLELTNSHYEH